MLLVPRPIGLLRDGIGDGEALLLFPPPMGLSTDGLGDGEVVLLLPPPIGLLVIASNSDSDISKSAVQQTCMECIDAFRDWECVDAFLGVAGFDEVLGVDRVDFSGVFDFFFLGFFFGV